MESGSLKRIQPSHPSPVVGHVRHTDDKPHKKEHEDRIRRQDCIGNLATHKDISDMKPPTSLPRNVASQLLQCAK